MTRWIDAPSIWPAFLDELRPRVGTASTVEAAAQLVCQAVANTLPTTVLVRVYGMLPVATLPAEIIDFAAGVAGGSKLESTRVLTLLGTDGHKAEWRDRRASKGHQGIPLLSTDFVEGIPMLARLLNELGLELSWLDAAPDVFTRKLIGGFNGIFYVRDAATARDKDNRLIIPAQDFVEEHHVRTVFGMGGANPNGMMLTLIAFTSEEIPRATVERLSSLISMLKTETFGLMLQQKLFVRPV